MSEPTQDRLREALRAWDPATRVDRERSRALLDEVRREIRRNGSRRNHRLRVVRRSLAAAAAIAIVLAATVLLKDFAPWTGAPSPADSNRGVETETQRIQPDLATPQHLTLVASNGVRIDWTILAPTPAEARSDRIESEGSNR